jgi:DNA-binding response OmpR family regulator
LRTTLSEVGFEVSQASNGPTGLALAERERFDAVVCDVSMPGMSGWEVAAKLRSTYGSGLAILMLSANAFERHGLSGQQAAHDAFLLKPVELGGVIDALGRHLRLEWLFAEQEGHAKSAEAETSLQRISPAAREHVERLASLVRIGHVRALEGEIQALSQAEPAGAELAERLFGCLDRFDLAAMGRMLEDLPDEWR